MTDETDTSKAERVAEAKRIAALNTQAQAERRRERAAQKLRENLMRRKSQARARRAGGPDETDGLPAAHLPQPDDTETSNSET
ncbi:hypothetical protein RvVAT039_21540 [Agrobacterium vitis]|uniref:hypothetical protein n=1 Tax=Agrobacterium vitis TaxID=373 RepID=UPI0015DCC557|nr:hypothetical protein [Agrobacterium vitis]BCH64938.1 hypothetical protein RvVAT039_21540 [Agrobacterium vitis]